MFHVDESPFWNQATGCFGDRQLSFFKERPHLFGVKKVFGPLFTIGKVKDHVIILMILCVLALT